jgi:hypothetical protein
MDIQGHTIVVQGDRQASLDGLMWSELPKLCAKYDQFNLEVTNAKLKSQKQLGAMFGLAFKILVEELTEQGQDTSLLWKLPESTGIKITADDLKIYFVQAFPMRDKSGLPKRMSKYTTTEMAQLYEKIQNFSAGQWKVFIPNPDKTWFLKEQNGKL